MAISVSSSWLELATYSFGKFVPSLLPDTRLTNAVRDKALGSKEDASFASRVDMMTDGFHGHVHFSAEQRKVTRLHSLNGTLPLAQIYGMFNEHFPVPVPAMLKPNETAYALASLTGPYPVGSRRGRPHSPQEVAA